MAFEQIQCKFRDSVFYVASHINSYSVCSGKDFTRRRKLPADMLISFLVFQGASSTDNELIDFFDFSPSVPSLSALNQQRDKLKPEALEAVFHLFNQSTQSSSTPAKYRFLAVDGSTLSFFSKPSLASDDYFFPKAIPRKAFTASISMLFTIFLPILTWMPFFNLFGIRMNSGLFVTWLIVRRSRLTLPGATLGTGDTVPTTIWHMFRKNTSFFCFVPRMSPSGEWHSICQFQKKGSLTHG